MGWGAAAARAVSAVVDGLKAGLLRSPEAAGMAVLQAATLPAELAAGRYFFNLTPSRPDAFAEDPAVGAELWAAACRLTGVASHASLARPGVK